MLNNVFLNIVLFVR